MLRRYIREGNGFNENARRRLGCSRLGPIVTFGPELASFQVRKAERG
jgi:hypothetical protein